MTVEYSQICEVSEVAYLAYLSAVLLSGQDGSSAEQSGRFHGIAREGCSGCGDNNGVSAFVAAAVRSLEGRTGEVRSRIVDYTFAGSEGVVDSRVDGAVAGGAPVGGLSAGHVDSDSCGGGGCHINDAVVGQVSGIVDSKSDNGSVGRGCQQAASSLEQPVKVVGKWAASNRRKKVRRRLAREKNRGVPEWRRNARPTGFCETVLTQSSCPSYGQAVSDAEREAKESLAKRRAAENAVAEKLAKLKLESLEDEQKCAEYATLKRQRVIQWTNEATAKSQQSLDKCKSIDPGSSSSQFEIRRTAKKLADLEMQHAHLIKVFHDAVPDAAKIIAMTKLPGTESMERFEIEGQFIGGNECDDYSVSS